MILNFLRLLAVEDKEIENEATIGDKIVETLYSNRVTSKNKNFPHPFLSPPFKVLLGFLLFSIGYGNSNKTLHGGDGGGKAIFSPFEVSKTSESPLRAKCLN